MSEDWTRFNNAGIAIDVRQYVKKHSKGNRTNNVFLHMDRLQQTFLDYWDTSSEFEIPASARDLYEQTDCSELLTSASWLNGFVTDQGDFTAAIQALAASASHCTQLVLHLNTLLSNAIVMSDWKLRALKTLKAWDNQSDTPRILDFSAAQVTFVIP